MYLFKIMKRKKKAANTRLADDYFSLLVPIIFLGQRQHIFERSHIYAALTEWRKLESHIRNNKKWTHLNVKLRKTLYF